MWSIAALQMQSLSTEHAHATPVNQQIDTISNISHLANPISTLSLKTNFQFSIVPLCVPQTRT